MDRQGRVGRPGWPRGGCGACRTSGPRRGPASRSWAAWSDQVVLGQGALDGEERTLGTVGGRASRCGCPSGHVDQPDLEVRGGVEAAPACARWRRGRRGVWRSGSVAKRRAVRSSWLRVKRLTPGVPAVVMAVMVLLLRSVGSAVSDGRGRWLRIRRHRALSVRCRSRWIRRYAVRLGFMERLRDGASAFSVTPGLVRARAQAQQQHRMAHGHMGIMCGRLTAVVEDMAASSARQPGGRPPRARAVSPCGPRAAASPAAAAAGGRARRCNAPRARPARSSDRPARRSRPCRTRGSRPRRGGGGNPGR